MLLNGKTIPINVTRCGMKQQQCVWLCMKGDTVNDLINDIRLSKQVVSTDMLNIVSCWIMWTCHLSGSFMFMVVYATNGKKYRFSKQSLSPQSQHDKNEKKNRYHSVPGVFKGRQWCLNFELSNVLKLETMNKKLLQALKLFIAEAVQFHFLWVFWELLHIFPSQNQKKKFYHWIFNKNKMFVSIIANTEPQIL